MVFSADFQEAELKGANPKWTASKIFWMWICHDFPVFLALEREGGAFVPHAALDGLPTCTREVVHTD